MTSGAGVPPGARRTYSWGAGGIYEPTLGAAVYRSPLLKFRRTPTQAQYYAQKTLAVAAAFTRMITSWELVTSKEIAGQSGFTWRDQFYAGMFGTGVEFSDVNGVQWYSRRELAMNIQQLLDSISSNPGSILVRTASGWAALYPGSAGKVMTVNPSTGLPDWLTAASGGGGGILPATFKANGTSGDSYCSEGYFFKFPIPCKIVALQAMLDPGAIGRTYDLYCGPFDSSTDKLSATPTKAGTFTSTATGGPQLAAINLPTPLSVSAGDTIAFWVTRTDGSTTSQCDTYYSVSYTVDSFYFSVPIANGLKLRSLAPSTADTWSTAAALYAMSFLYQP